jgi:hypothetical protein
MPLSEMSEASGRHPSDERLDNVPYNAERVMPSRKGNVLYYRCGLVNKRLGLGEAPIKGRAVLLLSDRSPINPETFARQRSAIRGYDGACALLSIVGVHH